MRSGICAAGNWIVDHVKVVDHWPEQDTLADIRSETRGNGGGAFNLLADLAKLGSPFALEGVAMALWLMTRDNAVWRLPFMIFEADTPWYREAVRFVAGYGFRRFEASNLGHFPLLREEERGEGNLQITTDYRLFSLNSQALLCWQELGAAAATLYIEDDADNMTALLAAELPIRRRIMVYSGVPAITTKIRIKDIRSDVPVVSDRGEGYRVTTRDGLTVVTPDVRFSLTACKGRLKEMGGASYVIDLSQLPQEEWGRVFNAFNRGIELPGTSEFNFTMGLV